MRNNDVNKPGLSRRDLLSNAAAATGALVVGFWMPQRAAGQMTNPEGAAWATEPDVKEINAWVVVAPDNTVTIRIAQTELGQGVWTCNASGARSGRNMLLPTETARKWRPNGHSRSWAKGPPIHSAAASPNSAGAAAPVLRASRTAFIGECEPTPPHP